MQDYNQKRLRAQKLDSSKPGYFPDSENEEEDETTPGKNLPVPLQKQKSLLGNSACKLFDVFAFTNALN